jgi:hypothetical protein
VPRDAGSSQVWSNCSPETSLRICPRGERSKSSTTVDAQREEARVSSPSVTAVVRLLGLSELVETTGGDVASVPLGVLYPYSRDLQRVCAF